MPSRLDLFPARPQHALVSRRYYKGRNVARAQSIADLRAMALRRLPRFSAEYLEGGAEEEYALRGNREAFSDYTFMPRSLRDVSKIDLSTEILGAPTAHPFVISPTGFNGLLWAEGDRLLAQAAAKAGMIYGQSTVSTTRVGDIAQIAGLRHWFQLYLYGPDAAWHKVIADAEAAGCEALVVTVDTNVLGNREWDRRNYGSGMGVSFSSKLDILRHPRWLWNVVLKNRRYPSFANLEQFVPEKQRHLFAIAAWSSENEHPEVNWETLKIIRSLWPRKLLIKGVQHLDDVRLALDAGVDGIVLSNHGGRQLDRAIAPIRLVEPARLIATKPFTILVDSGFRRGGDIVTALALGADGVLLGRAMLYGLAAGGEAGVTRAITILREEMARTMALLGVTSIDQLSKDVFAR